MRRIFFCAAAMSAFVAGPSFAACQLDSGDLASLQLSNSHIQSQDQADSLDPKNNTLLCGTREWVREIHANGDRLPDGLRQYSPYYMTPDETRLVQRLVSAWLAANPDKWSLPAN